MLTAEPVPETAMRQIVITAAGGPEKLVVRDAPDPQPGAGTVRIRVRASGINFADILARKGLYPDAPKIPCVVGYEVSGTVDAVGDGVDRAWIGRDVLAMTRFGGYADVVVAPLDQVFDKPASLSFEQAAAIPVNYLTAWQLLVTMGALKADETVLIHNAGGGVGLAAIDVARHIGARIIGTASAGKHGFLKQRGLHEAIDYRSRDWSPEVARLTDKRGVELVTDPLGGNHWKKSYAALRSTGRLGMFGISVASESKLIGPLRLLPVALGMPFFHPIALMNSNRSVFGVNLGHMWHETAMLRPWMQSILKGVADGWVRPHVDRAFGFAQAGEAQTYMEQRRNTGKVVLLP
jgi:NADPH:quinone reductase-like Zn-dependent oxidoreductase